MTVLAEIDERAWTKQVVELATLLGWRRYHTWRSKHSAAGWPDEALCRDRLILAELKMQGKKPSAVQVEWLDALARAGSEAYLWWPSDLEEIARILGKPWKQEPTGRRLLYAQGSTTWLPKSLWISGVGRADTA